MGPTIGLLAGYTDVELNALGDWTEEVKSSTMIPANYAGSKEVFSTRMKHLTYALACKLTPHESWEVIPTDALQKAMEAAEDLAPRKIHQDTVTRWQAKASSTSVKKSLDFVQMAKEQREKAIYKAVAAGRPAMPRAVGGKLLTKYLRNGTALCSRFQTDECREETCQEAHVCAVVSRTGRACGGRHPATRCWTRKARFEEPPVSQRQGGATYGPMPASSSESVTPQKKRRAVLTEEAKKRLRLGQQAPVTPPRAAPMTTSKAAAAVLTISKSAPQPPPQPKAPPIPRTPVPEPKFPQISCAARAEGH